MSLHPLIFVVIVFYGLLAQLFSFRVDLSAQLPGVDLCRFGDLLLPVLLLIRAGLDMGPVNENRAGVQHPVIQCLVEDVLKNLTGQLIWKAFAECIVKAIQCQRQRSLSLDPASLYELMSLIEVVGIAGLLGHTFQMCLAIDLDTHFETSLR